MQIGNVFRRFLYKNFSLDTYLTILSKLYFISFKLGFLKVNGNYDYQYFLKNILKKGNVCIDIGANLGYYTCLISEIVGEEGFVYAVEPVKPMLNVLVKNTRKQKNVAIYPFALGDENKRVKLGNNTIKENGFLGSGRHTVVKSVDKSDISFDAEMKKGSELFKELTTIDFIKCDIEGYELIVLMEMKPLILKHRPILLIETCGENRKQLINFFNKNDFVSHVLNGDSLEPVSIENQNDILVIPFEKGVLI